MKYLWTVLSPVRSPFSPKFHCDRLTSFFQGDLRRGEVEVSVLLKLSPTPIPPSPHPLYPLVFFFFITLTY